MAVPKTLKVVRSCVGALNFHRRFIPAFAEKVHSLNKAICRGDDFKGLALDSPYSTGTLHISASWHSVSGDPPALCARFVLDAAVRWVRPGDLHGDTC